MENEKEVMLKENVKIEKEFESCESANKSEDKQIEDDFEKQLKIEDYYLNNEDPDVEEENSDILLNAA